MKNRIGELDALRGLAALSVVIYHFTVAISFSAYRFNIGCMGVDLFFIISGFVIFMTIQKCNTWKEFVISRFSRLFPIYWTCVTLTFIALLIMIFTHKISNPYSNLFSIYLGNMTMFQYYFKIPNIDGSYWTLIIELCFYFFMLLLLITKNIKKIEIYSFFFLFIVVLNCFFYDYIQNNYWLHKIRILIPILNYYPLFFTGILIYKIKHNSFSISQFFLIFLCYLIQLYLFDKCYFNKGVVNFHEYFLVLTFIYGLFILYIVNILKYIVILPFVKLGEISYSLYLIHQFIGTKIIMPFLTNTLGLNLLLSFLLALILIILIASLLNKYIEKPSLQYIRRKLNPTTTN